jgi:hypothetical protein
MQYKLLYIFLIIILIFELLKCTCNTLHHYSNTYENFTSTSNYILSKTEKKNSSDANANIDEEIYIGMQNKGTNAMQLEYNYIRTPLGRYLGIYVKRIFDNEEKLIHTKVIEIVKNNYNILDLIKDNKLLSSNATTAMKYYIKFLSDNSYKKELDIDENEKTSKSKYVNCMKENFQIYTKSKSAEICKPFLK